MPPQNVYNVNCPWCGEIVKVVCPKVNREAREVAAHQLKPLLNFGGSTVTNGACPECGRVFYVEWWFD